MLFLGITGGVGAGKSEILAYLRENYKGKVMLADAIAHDLMEPGTLCYNRLRDLFAGEKIWAPDGSIDRPEMARLIFSNQEMREQMNGIVHPAVKKYVIDSVKSAKEEGTLDLIVLEAALLIEEQYDKICDELWYIYTSPENRRMRLSQLPEETYRAKCEEVIDNNGTPEQAFDQIREKLEKRGIYPNPRR